MNEVPDEIVAQKDRSPQTLQSPILNFDKSEILSRNSWDITLTKCERKMYIHTYNMKHETSGDQLSPW